MVAGGIGDKKISQEKKVNECIFAVFSGTLNAGTFFQARAAITFSIKFCTFHTQTLLLWLSGERKNVPSSRRNHKASEHSAPPAPRAAAALVATPSGPLRQGFEENSHPYYLLKSCYIFNLAEASQT